MFNGVFPSQFLESLILKDCRANFAKSYSLFLMTPMHKRCKNVLPSLSVIIGSPPIFINYSKDSQSSFALAAWIADIPFSSFEYGFGFPCSNNIWMKSCWPLMIAWINGIFLPEFMHGFLSLKTFLMISKSSLLQLLNKSHKKLFSLSNILTSWSWTFNNILTASKFEF